MENQSFSLRCSGFSNLPDNTKRVLASVEDTPGITPQSAYEFVCSELVTKQSIYTRHLNKQVYAGIEALVVEDMWTDLRRIAKYSIEAAACCLREGLERDARLELKPSTLSTEMLKHVELELAALVAGGSAAGGSEAYREVGRRMLDLADEIDARLNEVKK